MAHENYLTELTQKGDEIRFVFYEKARVDAGKIDGFLKDYRGKMKFTVDANPYFTYLKPRKSGRDNEDILTGAGDSGADERTGEGIKGMPSGFLKEKDCQRGAKRI